MSIENRMFRQQQRDNGNPYKEESRQWLAWSRGYTAGMLAATIKEWDKRVKPKHRVSLRRSSTDRTEGTK